MSWSSRHVQIFQRDGDGCHYCKELVKFYTIDHKVARSKGGTDDLDNLVRSCIRCNALKGSRDYEEFVAWLPKFLSSIDPSLPMPKKWISIAEKPSHAWMRSFPESFPKWML